MRKPIQFDIYIRKVSKQVNPSMQTSSNYLNQLNYIIVRLGEKIAEKAFQLTEKEDRKTINVRAIGNATRLILKSELAKYAYSQGTRAVTIYTSGPLNKRGKRSERARLIFSISRCKQFLMKYKKRITEIAPVYLAGVLEYITGEISELAGNATRDNKRSTMKIRDLYLAIENDDELRVMMRRLNLGITGSGKLPHIDSVVLKKLTEKKSRKPKKKSRKPKK
jgi:histone H2A